MKIYVASSWRNDYQQEVLKKLREAGHEVYDFKNPPNSIGFKWSDIDPDWENWTNEQYREALKHPIAERGFSNDFNGMQWADCCVMVMPCGRSAHAEAGWMQGNGKFTIVLQPKEAEPELMYKLFELVTDDLSEVIAHIDLIDLGFLNDV